MLAACKTLACDLSSTRIGVQSASVRQPRNTPFDHLSGYHAAAPILAAAAATNVDWESMHPSGNANFVRPATDTFSWTDTRRVADGDRLHYCDWDGATEIHSPPKTGRGRARRDQVLCATSAATEKRSEDCDHLGRHRGARHDGDHANATANPTRAGSYRGALDGVRRRLRTAATTRSTRPNAGERRPRGRQYVAPDGRLLDAQLPRAHLPRRLCRAPPDVRRQLDDSTIRAAVARL